MSHFVLQVTQKGALYSGDCRKCGQTHFVHEWATWSNNEERAAMQAGALRCADCSGMIDPETFRYCGRQYAARYSAPGYLDCTDWFFGANRRKLVREVRDFYDGDF